MDQYDRLIATLEKLPPGQDQGTVVPVPMRGCALLVVALDDDHVGYVNVSVERLNRSPDEAWTALRHAWVRLGEQERERAVRAGPHPGAAEDPTAG